jgi:hypothetical protein
MFYIKFIEIKEKKEIMKLKKYMNISQITKYNSKFFYCGNKYKTRNYLLIFIIFLIISLI